MSFRVRYASIVCILAASLFCGLAQPQAHAGQLWSTRPYVRPAKAEALPNFVALAADLGPAVVHISTEQGGGSSRGAESQGGGEPFGEPFTAPHGRSLGSGFIINSAGYIVTNDHVIENGRSILVSTRDGSQYRATVVGRDHRSDVALLKIDAGHPLPVAPLGDSETVKVGQWVMAIGDPFGFDHTVTAGIISAKGRFISGSYDDFLQTDASINPGNSGGPLINLQGEVVGVNSAIFTRTGSNTGIGFAIPINLVKQELPQLKEHGRVVRGWLGIYVQRVTSAIAESMGLPGPHGALVAEVLPKAPGKKAGLRRGDVILAYDGHKIGDSRQLPLLVGRTPLGHTVMLTVIRDRKRIDLPVTITASRAAEIASAASAPLKASAPFGLTVKDLSPKLAHEMGLADARGVVVYSVEPGSVADEAGLHAHDIILEVNRKAVANVDAYRRAMRSSAPGKVVLLLVKRHNSTVFVPLTPEG